MKKICPKCKSEMPREANFCLNCFHNLNSGKGTDKKRDKLLLLFLPWWKAHKRKILTASALALAFLVIMGICIVAMKHLNSGNVQAPADTTIIKETQTVAVTNPQGEPVTDQGGEQVFEVVEVTKIEAIPAPPTTEKQGFLDKIFNSAGTTHKDKTETDKNEGSSSPQSEGSTTIVETTKKPGFLDEIIDAVFGDDEKTTSAPSTNKETTENRTTTTPDTEVEHGTTESPVPSTTMQAPTTTQKPTQTTTVTTTLPQTTAPVSAKDFEYTISGNYATITRYTGSASNVTIPAVIDGKAVSRIKGKTFSDNTSVQVVTFATSSKQPYLWIEPQTFNNCPNLKKINFSETDLGIMNQFAMNCPSVEDLSINSAQYKCIDGTLYYHTGSTWALRWHCPANPATTINLPSYCTMVESSSNLKEAVNVKTINVHSNVTTLPHPSILPPNLENIFVAEGNPKAFDINGVAFFSDGGMWGTLYPAKNKTKTLTLPENTRFYDQYINNAYLETLYIPKTTKLYSVDTLIEGRMFTSLKNLHIQEGHEKEAYILKNSTIQNTAKY